MIPYISSQLCTSLC